MAESTERAAEESSPISGVHRAIGLREPTPKPLLASELLRLDAAPVAPGGKACRLWYSWVAVSLVLLGVALELGIGTGGATWSAGLVSVACGVTALALAFAPLGYATKAGLALLTGTGLLLLGAAGEGPLAGVVVDGSLTRHSTRFVALTALPAALLFRARYREYARGSVVLAIAMLLSLPLVAVEARLALDLTAAPAARAAAGLSVLTVAAAALGFVRQQSTTGGSFLAVLVLAVLPAGVALRELTPLADQASGRFTYLATAIGLAAAGVLTSTGAYQLLASAFGSDARRCAGGAHPPQP